MPRSDEDLSDELLALAGDGGKQQQRKKRTGSGSNKKRKHELDSDSEQDEPESEDSEEEPYYPLEGKFKDDEDREYLLSLPEIKREAILSARQEQMQKHLDTKALERMVKSQGAGVGAVSGDGDVYKAAKRKHTAPGSTKEKSRTLEALKEKRQAKESRRSKKARGSDSPPLKRQRSTTPSSSSEDEEGQYQPSPSKHDETSKESRVKDETITHEDLNKVRVTRDMLEKHCMATWFEDYVKGSWVRLLVGMDNGEPVHRICEVIDVSSENVEPYRVNNKFVDKLLELKHGASTKAFPMSKISCGAFTEREFDRIIKTLQFDKVKLPTKSKLEKKAEEIQKFESHKLTELEIAAMVNRQSQIRNKPTQSQVYFEKARLNQARVMASKQGDHAEVDRLTAAIAELDGKGNKSDEQTKLEAVARVNERNRRANMEGVRKAEIETAARRKKEAMAGAPVKVDLSARVRTIPKIRHDSRPGTPSQSNQQSAPQPPPTSEAIPAAPTSRSTVDKIAASVVLDLDDFI
ncbi:hypothetical protein FRC02_008513 [Tulasnella sp. 418]|nr:hypothetical protein FRC02_008513 [Tulasnella sp. 418]